MSSNTSVDFVIPVHNEEKNLKYLFHLLDEFYLSSALSGHMIFVEDASTDSSFELIKEYSKVRQNVKVIRNYTNIGCHASVLMGLHQAVADWAVFIPSDLQIRPEIAYLLNQYPQVEAPIVIGTKRNNRKDYNSRILLSRVYNKVIRAIFRIEVQDIDSSQILNRAARNEILPLITSKSSFIAAEIFIVAKRRNVRVFQFEIEHHARTNGKASAVSIFEVKSVLVEILKFLMTSPILKSSYTSR